MKNKFFYSIVAIALTMLLSAKTFAQKTVAYIYKDAPITQVQKTATFQVVLDNIDNDQEKNEFAGKFKTCKQILSVVPSAITDNKVTYTITMEKENIFMNFQRALSDSNIETTEFFGKQVATHQFGQIAEAEYNKTVTSQRNPK